MSSWGFAFRRPAFAGRFRYVSGSGQLEHVNGRVTGARKVVLEEKP
jgi:hypothetical protein